MTAWWESCRPGSDDRVVLVQIDLKGHSPWAASQTTDREPSKDRTEFAIALSVRLGYEGFDCLYWLGDGGVFARQFRGNTDDADAAITAADVTFASFRRFQQTAPGASRLSIRVTATLISVILHPLSSHWCSPALNEFLKHERDVGIPGACVVTQDLYRQLSSSLRERFAKSREVVLPTHSITAYIDSQHPFVAEESPRRFSTWLRDHAADLPAPSFADDPPEPSSIKIGRAAVLNTALAEGGYPGIQVVQAQCDWDALTQWLTGVLPAGTNIRAYRSAHYGIATAPLRLAFPLSDFPDLVIEYALADYGLTHTFHQVLLDQPALRTPWLRSAYAYRNREGRAIPGGLAVEAAVVLSSATTGSEARGPKHLLLAHRVHRRGGYYGDHWSCSYGEQFMPLKSKLLKHERAPDKSLTDTAIRGIREEFLTDGFGRTIHVQLHAVLMQLDLLNITGLAVVRLPETSLEEVLTLWPSALDAAEHDALASLPIERDVLRAALRSTSPGQVWGLNVPEGVGPRVNDPWISSAHAEIACCLWLLECGLL